MLQTKLFEPAHYEMVAGWWKRHDWSPVPLEALSEIGLIAYHGETPLCAGWLYLMTKYWALIEWVVVNPDAPARQRKLGVELLLDRLITEAKFFPVEAIFCSLKSPGLIRLYGKHGFQVTDQGMTNMVLRMGDKCQSQPAPQLSLAAP